MRDGSLLLRVVRRRARHGWWTRIIKARVMRQDRLHNVGGGAKRFFGRWGLRGDYRLFAIHGEQDTPPFFATRTRYGHRVSAGIILNLYGLQADAANRR
jgi:hypothetical protein